MLPLLYFNFKSFLDAKSSTFIRFQCILHDSEVFFSEYWNFCKLNKGELISWGNQFSRKSELFGPPSVFHFWKFYGPTLFVIHLISMHSAWFRSTFLRVLKFLQMKEVGPNFWGELILSWFRSTFLRILKFREIKEAGPNLWGYSILQKVWIICSPPSVFQF